MINCERASCDDIIVEESRVDCSSGSCEAAIFYNSTVDCRGSDACNTYSYGDWTSSFSSAVTCVAGSCATAHYKA